MLENVDACEKILMIFIVLCDFYKPWEFLGLEFQNRIVSSVLMNCEMKNF